MWLYRGETTVRRLVKELREKNQEAFVPLAFPPGDALQIDWGEATVYLDSMKKTVNLFCARLCYSDAPIVLAYRRQNEESFLDALVQVFQYSAVFRNGLSLTMEKSPSKTVLALMPGNKRDMQLVCPLWLRSRILQSCVWE